MRSVEKEQAVTATTDSSDEARHNKVPPKLRFVVLAVDSETLPWWQAACVQAAQACGEAELVAFVNTALPSKSAGWKKKPRARPLTSLLPPQDWSNIPRWSPDDERLVTSCDFIFGFGGKNPLRWCPAQGVWEFRIGGLTPNDEEFPGSRELVRGLRTITAEWVSVGPGTVAGRTLHRSVHAIRSRRGRTCDALLQSAAELCVGAIRRVRRSDPSQNSTPPVAPALPYRPGKHRVVAAWLKHGIRRTIGFYKWDVWALGILPVPIDTLIAGGALPEPVWFEPPQPGTFHADPFPVTVDGQPHVLFEMWCDKDRRGWIAASRLDDPKGPANAGKAIDLGCHMSYPFVFQYDGATWCAPEVSEAGAVRVFRMGDTAEEWTLAHVALPDLGIVDPTLFEHDGRWWLFACLAEPETEGDLLAWYAATPFSKWTPHPLNPIKTDITSARPAGALFRIGGTLYRPGQDCAQSYGKAVVIHQIQRIDPEGFEETPVIRLQPGKDWAFKDGLHTINIVDERIIFDAKRCVIRWPLSFPPLRWRSKNIVSVP